MRKRRSLVVAAALVAALAVAAPAGAIQYGTLDGDGHPYVGLVVFYDDGVPLWRCTGTLISEDLFLTAGHCTDAPSDFAAIWFGAGPITLASGYPYSGWDASGTPYHHPDWNGSLTLPNTHDVGVVVLDESFPMSEYGLLPEEGVLDGLATRRGLQDQSFTVVGYGRQQVKPYNITERTRYVATTHLVDLRSALTDGYNIHLSSNPGNWSGGTCFGDSGGPVFMGTSRVIVAVNSFVLNLNCKGSGFGYRVDTSDARSFLDDFIAVP